MCFWNWKIEGWTAECIFIRILHGSFLYGKWLKPDGRPAGVDIPICTDEGLQAWPTLAYNPAMKLFLIVWNNRNPPDDYEPIPASGQTMVFDMVMDVKGVIYGKKK